MSKTLSVIIPLYNSAQWLEKCLMSVLNQDIPEEQLEIICINDGSPDNSAALARKMGEKHNCIVVLDQENQGPSGARNNGMRHATGKYLMFVDPDDYVEPNTFGGLVKQMEEERLDMLRFNFRMVDEDDLPLTKTAHDQLFDYTPRIMSGAAFMAERLDIACNIWRYIYRTEIIVKNNIWCFTGDYYDDTPWLPLVLLQTQRLDVVDTVVYVYQERRDGLVKAKSDKAIQRKIDGSLLLQRILSKELEEFKKNCQDGICDETKEGVVAWYKNMLAHSVQSLLSMCAQYRFAQRHEYIGILKEQKLFPLETTKVTIKIARKVKLINISPLLYTWLVYLNR